jgi:hypothetical protein
MPGQDHCQRMTDETRGVSCDEFVKVIERSGPTRRELVSIQDLAAELGVAIRTLRRWNKLPDAPKRYRQSRREMYRRADVQHWFERRARRPGATQGGGKSQ